MSEENVWKKVGENSVSIEEGADKMSENTCAESSMEKKVTVIKEKLRLHLYKDIWPIETLLSSLEVANKEKEKLEKIASLYESFFLNEEAR